MKIRFLPEKLKFEGNVANGQWEEITKGFYAIPSLEELHKIDRYRIEVSLMCNLKCEYCVVHMNKVTQQNTLMNSDVADRIIKRFNEEIGEYGSIFLMGGEPLTNINVVKQFIEGVTGKTIIFTNALGLDAELAEYFFKNDVYILTSLDGHSLYHNQKRFHPRVKDNFDKVTNNIKCAIDKGCKVGVSCLLHADNLKDALDIAEYFRTELHAKSMSFAYPHMTICDSAENEFDVKEYVKQLKRLYLWAKEKKVYIDQIGKIVGGIIYGYPTIAACKSGLSQRTFYPNGEETICTKLDTCPEYKADEYFSSLPAFNDFCKNCKARYLCGGGCVWDACVNSKNGLDHRICSLRRDLIEFIIGDIKETLEKAKTIGEAQQMMKNIFGPLCDNYSKTEE